MAYIRVSADLLNNVLVEVTRVSKCTRKVICMLETLKDRLLHRHLPSLSQFSFGVLIVVVDVLHPALMGNSATLANVLLKDHHVGVWNLLRIRRGMNRSGIIVNSVNDDWRTSRQQRQQRQAQNGPHGCSVVGMLRFQVVTRDRNDDVVIDENRSDEEKQ